MTRHDITTIGSGGGSGSGRGRGICYGKTGGAVVCGSAHVTIAFERSDKTRQEPDKTAQYFANNQQSYVSTTKVQWGQVGETPTYIVSVLRATTRNETSPPASFIHKKYN